MRPAISHRTLHSLAILAIAMLLLLGAAMGKMRRKVCVGECAQSAVVTANAGCCAAAGAAATHDSGSCCGCCEPHSGDADSGDANSGDANGGDTDGGERAAQPTRPRCCITVALADLEYGPLDLELPGVPPVLLPPPATPTWHCDARVQMVAHARPFDRGPPRVDDRTRLRGCVVMLI